MLDVDESSTTAPTAADPDAEGGSDVGMIIGIVVGVLVVAGAGFYYVKVYKKRDGAGYTEQP